MSYVIAHVRSWLTMKNKLPRLKWVLFQDNSTIGMYFPCSCGCKSILLDVIKIQNISKYLRSIVHEMVHYIFDFLPNPFYDWLSMLLDVTDGNQPYLLQGIEEPESITIYEW